jgi:LPXTG-motif cell wall-anchored protein
VVRARGHRLATWAQCAGAGIILVTAAGWLASPGEVAGAAGVSATVAPASGLVDGQRVAIHAAGFHPFTNILVEECGGTMQALPTDNTACEGFTGDTTVSADASGNYANDPAAANNSKGFKALLLPRPVGVRSPLTCDPTHPCVLYIGEDHNDFTQPHAFAAIAFGSATPAVPGPVAVPPPTGTGTGASGGTGAAGGTGAGPTSGAGANAGAVGAFAAATGSGGGASAGSAGSAGSPTAGVTGANPTAGAGRPGASLSGALAASTAGGSAAAHPLGSSTAGASAASRPMTPTASLGLDGLPKTGMPSASLWLAVGGLVLALGGSTIRFFTRGPRRRVQLQSI